MIWPFKRRPKSILGIDIGTSVIRVVELLKNGEQVKLVNYGFVSLAPLYEKTTKRVRKDTFFLTAKETSEILNSIFKEAKIESSRAVFSLPDFATFFTSFTLPPMSEEEIAQAVKFEARRHVPLPLSEVTLDWLITKKAPLGQSEEELEILLVVVPNSTINQYKKIIGLSGLEVLALEAEVFGLKRSLVKNNKKTIVLIDIGAQSTTCSIVDENILKVSHSFDIAGNDLTERLSKSFDLDYETAEQLKIKQGILKGERDTRKILTPMFDLMTAEIEKVTESFYQQAGKEVEMYILAGGSAFLPGLKEYFSRTFRREVKMANPFKQLTYPPALDQVLRELGPGFSVAVGMALKGLE